MYYGKRHTFLSKNILDDVIISGASGKELTMEKVKINKFKIDDTITYINSLNDFPSAIGGVITLVAGNLYIITKEVDLLGSRIVCSTNNCIYGISSEISFLTSTGLGVGIPLISSAFTVNLQNISIKDVDTAFSLIALTAGQVCDWKAVNIISVPNFGTIKDYSNFIYETGTFIDSAGIIFKGTFGTIGFFNSLFSNTINGTTFKFDADCVVSRRFKLFESSCVSTGTGVSIERVIGSTFPNNGIVLTSVNFSGGTSSHLVNISSDENVALFFKCIGISNSRSTGNIHYLSSVSTPLVVNTWTKLLSNTQPSSNNSKFTTLVNNRLVYSGNLVQTFLCIYNVSYTGTNGNVIETGVSYNNNAPTTDTISRSTLSASGRIEVCSNSFFVELKADDYLEVFARNITASNAVDAIQISLTVFAEL